MCQSLLVTPSYCDSARLAAFGPDLARELDEHNLNIRWVIADDGSGAGEVARLEALAAQFRSSYPHIEVFASPRRLGKGGIIHKVWDDHTGGGWLCFLDADGSVDGHTFVELLEKAESIGPGHALIASRMPSPKTEVRQSLYRRLAHDSFAWLVRNCLDLPVKDSQCGGKCIHSDDYQRVFPSLRETGLLFDSELLLALHMSGVKIVEVAVNWIQKHGGPVKPMRDAIPMLLSMLKVRKRLR